MAGRIPRGTVSHQKRRKILHDHLLLHRLGAEPGKYAVADSMEGDWGTLKNWRRNYLPEPGSISAELKRTAPLHRRPLNAENYFESGYVAYPLKVENGELVMEYCEETDLGKYL